MYGTHHQKGKQSMTASLNQPAGTQHGGFAVTASGKTYYEYRQGKRDQTVVFIHGFALPSGIWKKNYYCLADRGYHALRFDRYGVGRSTTSHCPYSLKRFVDQLKELVDVIHPPLPLSLVGLSMGGAVAARFAAVHPALVGSLCLIAPAVAEALPAASRLAALPGLGRIIFRYTAKTILKRNLSTTLPPDEADDSFQRECLAQADRLDYRRALRSTLRHTMLRRDSFAYAPVPSLSVPVHLIWGTEDTVVPFRYAAALQQALGKCEFFPIAGAGHCPPWERADEVNDILSALLRQA
jgi:pimeloyl-ACP methyl ester carboxylesterase